MAYIDEINALTNPSFQEIRNVAKSQLSSFSKSESDKLWNELKRGTALLNTPEHLYQYLYSYGNMHQAKLLDAIQKLPSELLENPFEVIDWGCGQAMGTINLFDFLNENNFNNVIQRITLIEPASLALEQGAIHTATYINDEVQLVQINDFFENITPDRIKSDTGLPVLHIFSNILDVAQIDLKHLSGLINESTFSDNFFLAVGPRNPNNHRIDAFLRYFKEDALDAIYEYETQDLKGKKWTYKARVYKLPFTAESILIPIEYYPSVQFASCYELDTVRNSRKSSKIKYTDALTHFEVSAPFDLGANVYENIHTILAIVHNIIVRGLPTKSSVYIEEYIQDAFKNTTKEINYGEIGFHKKDSVFFENIQELFLRCLNKELALTETEKTDLQLLLTPIAVARFQKVLIEALITGHLPLNQTTWTIMAQEEDVPFARIAIEDFKMLFNHLTQLSEDYHHLKLPEIDLHIKGNQIFKDSPLNKTIKVYQEVPKAISSQNFDLVVKLAMLKTDEATVASFSDFKCRNNCYFDIRTISKKRSKRVIYTSNLVQYKSLVEKDAQGNYFEVEKNKKHLTYLLQLLFRKEEFRAGQLPILDRALRNLPVIGLLPTGGGKSLTYQLAALMQPGVTMIVDPLKSLMKDQYDGLVNNGIDSSAYINSSLTKKQRLEKENQLKSSELQFIFLSPERLSMADFREDLKHMHDYNVYFSYGVIDEVHCVSEWGHDFRFSYLHLGRNLYNYVKAKDNEISLLGLTATASFDVLADVERELSGNGAFELDTDTIVRYENTNRLELQYKVEKVPVQFAIDRFYDQNGAISPELPKALNITNHWPQYDSKSFYLNDFIRSIPTYVNELQNKENIDFINKRFIERQNNEEGANLDLHLPMSNIPNQSVKTYPQAGIVFCPHVRSTGLSVQKNTTRLSQSIPNVGSFSGQDDDGKAMKSLDNFRDNKSPLMIATKAFGMGIDKPNVRYTVNMNYSSSLEGFVQEAGRAGRDRKVALSSILISDYDLASIKKNTQVNTYPISIIRNKWFHSDDLNKIIKHYNLNVPDEDILIATPEKDIVKLFCSKDNKMFGYMNCNQTCSAFRSCTLKKANQESRGWKTETELVQELNAQGLNLGKKHFQYLNPDYQSVMFFFNQNFKGDIVEKTFMHNILSINNIYSNFHDAISRENPKKGFLENVLTSKERHITVFVPYNKDNYSDIAKAIYRMCCIELVEDFTQDYRNKLFRIIAVRKKEKGYYEGLKRFLYRYFTADRALIEVKKAQSIQLRDEDLIPLKKEIYKCLSYLTGFVYDKISEKRKRAIDDMRSFCLEGINPEYNWIEANEKLKDFIYYYFNSKYAKTDYIAENGEPFSLVNDTDSGKISDMSILHKYLRVIDDDIVGIGTPLDNVKHLYGAIRLISRSLTDTNPALGLLETFCLVYLGTKQNKNLENQVTLKYSEAFLDSYERAVNSSEFWNLFEDFNSKIEIYMEPEKFKVLSTETRLLIHSKNLAKLTSKYLEYNE